MAETTDPRALASLPPVAAGLGQALGRPVALAMACLIALVGLGWITLAVMVAGWAARHGAGALGPGMGALDFLAEPGGRDLIGRALLDVVCRPGFGQLGWSVTDAALAFLMWAAMTLAMMLPSAGPMIVTYAQIADTAARQREPAVSPVILTAGYVGVWIGFAAAAVLLQAALTRLALLEPAMVSASPLFSGAIFIGAGAYQFSQLKQACVTHCQRPFPFFFANWSTERRAIFGLGMRQGLYCLGCCWAAMMMMFAVGVMNVVWMAALGSVMTAEKMATTTRLCRIVGIAFLVIGTVFIAGSVAAYWPRAML
jgi:predicted metal-binding membrane protein